MIVLDIVNRKLQVLMAATATTTESPIVASYSDISATSFTPKANQSITAGTTPIDIVPAPATATQRMLKYLAVNNADTVQRIVSVQYNDNGTTRLLQKATLAVGDTLTYSNGQWTQTAKSSVLPAINGGTGVANTGTITNGGNTTRSGSGTLSLGGLTMTVPATGTAALLGTANAFAAAQGMPAGSAAAPGMNFAGIAGNGIWGGGTFLAITNLGSSIMGVNGSGFFMGGAKVVGFTSTADPIAAGMDTGFSRIGTLGVASSPPVAALGNALAGGFSRPPQMTPPKVAPGRRATRGAGGGDVRLSTRNTRTK